jgi:hypothetical protein
MPVIAKGCCTLDPAGTALFRVPFGRQEEPMIKALLTPVILGLAVAMVIRMTMMRRA